MEKLKKYLEISVLAVPIGIITGMLCALFGIVLLKLSGIRDENRHLILFLPIAGLFIMFIMEKLAGISRRGMNLVFEAGHGDEDRIPVFLIPLVTATTWITHLFGGSAGREGVAVQIGAAVSHNFSRFIKKDADQKIFIIMGMAAGFGGLFGTPVAAVFFAIGVLVAGKIYYEAIIPSFIAAFFAKETAQYLGLESFHYIIEGNIDFTPEISLKILIISVLFGITGGMFAYILKKTKNFLSAKFKDSMKKIFFGSVPLMIIIYTFHAGRYAGLGTNLISASFAEGRIYSYDFIVKFIITVLTLSLGYQGGEVTPIFSIGASLGAVLGMMLNLPPELASALGYTAVFSSATNTLFGPVFIGAEVFGWNNLPLFLAVCTVSYICNGGQSIYALQKKKKIFKKL